MNKTEVRTAERIDLIVNDADYRDETDAVNDAWRVALLASVPGAENARERARADAVWRANVVRDPNARRPRRAGRAHIAFFFVATLIGVLGVAFITPSPRDGHTVFDLQEGALLAGIFAVVAAACYWWLEPIRASGDLAGSHIPAGFNLFFAVYWMALVGHAVLFRLHEIDRYEPAGPIIGLVLLAIAGTGQVVLWRRGRRADLSGRQTGTLHTTRGLIDERDNDAVLAALDHWWATAGEDAERSDPARLASARDLVLRHLAETGFIQAKDLRRALADTSPARWRERRP